MVLAEVDSAVPQWALWLGSAWTVLSTIAVGVIAIKFAWSTKKTEAAVAYGEAGIKLEKEQGEAKIKLQKEQNEVNQEIRAHDIESHTNIIEDLRGDVKEQRKNYNELQRSVTARLNETTTAHHECEKKYAVLDDRLQRTLKELADNQKYTESLESRIKVLESTPVGGPK